MVNGNDMLEYEEEHPEEIDTAFLNSFSKDHLVEFILEGYTLDELKIKYEDMYIDTVDDMFTQYLSFER